MIPYNPCGRFVDWGHGSWKTKCRFFRDSDVEADIIWYPCLPGAPKLGFPTAITNAMFDRDEIYGPTGKWEGVGEVYDAGRSTRAPKTKPAATGRHVCGTRADFERGAAYDPTIAPRLYRADGLPVCCVPGRGLLIGGAVRGRTGGGLLLSSATRPRSASGLLIGGPARRTTGGLLLARAPFQGCDSYDLSVTLSGPTLLTRTTTSGPLWDNGAVNGTGMFGAEPETLQPWFLFAGTPGESLYTSGTYWDGQGTRTFTRLFGPFASSVDVTCAD